MTYRILVTGSRDWGDVRAIHAALELADAMAPCTSDGITLVEGNADGADRFARNVARDLGWQVVTMPHGGDPLARNLAMVEAGADICLAFATRWASGTGHCARAARRAGIRVVDMGVSTKMEDRP